MQLIPSSFTTEAVFEDTCASFIDIDNDNDLDRYLNKHKHELYASLGAKSWEYCVDFLKDTAIKYLEEGQDDIETDPVPDCSISSDNKVYIALPGLMLIRSKNPKAVAEIKKEWRSKNMRNVSEFSLVKSDGEYYCKFALVRAERTHSLRTASAKSRKRNTSTKGTPPGSTSETPSWSSLAKLCAMIAKAELGNSKAYARVDFDDIQGRQVSGGAVELGKKR